MLVVFAGGERAFVGIAAYDLFRVAERKLGGQVTVQS
jgi:hypothetical protein